MRGLWRVGLVYLLAVSTAGVATAHEVGGSRFDAPLPLPLLYAGAGVTVLATAGWLAVSSETSVVPDARRRLVRIPRQHADSVTLAARGTFLLAFLLAIVTGVLGSRVPAENFATVLVWPIWLKGIALVAAVVGSPWRILSPWRTLYAGLRRLEGEEIAVIGPYPSWIGEWPALLGFVVWIGIVENLTAVPRSPRATTLLVAAYAAAMLLGAVAYGDEWFERADALAVLYRLFGRVAPLEIVRTPSAGYAISVRYPWAGCTRPIRDLAVAGFVIATVFTVSFDGFASTPEYRAILFVLRDATGFGPSTGVVLYVVGFAAFLGSFAVVAAVADRSGGRRDVRSALLAFAPTLLPIAVAYEVAHNYPFVARNLGQLVFVLGRHVEADPAPVEPLAWLSLPTFWASQALLIVGGHVVAVVAAHYVTRERYPTRARSARAHLPLTVLMVGYTVLSLWIVSRPVVT